MLGVLCPGQGKIKAEQRNILGLHVLWVSVPVGGYWEKRRLTRGQRLLVRRGVRRLLPVRNAPDWRLPLPVVGSAPLCRALAAELVLAVLERKGIAPEESSVALVGDYVDGEMVMCARQLCPQVRTLLIRTNYGAERLAQLLYREFGAAAALEGRSDVQVRFSGAPSSGELVLCGRPRLLGLQVEWPGAQLPEELEVLPLLTALWQAGRISVKDLHLREEKCEFDCKEGGNMV